MHSEVNEENLGESSQRMTFTPKRMRTLKDDGPINRI